ncbi:MAG: hypothetical protein ABIL11_16655 [Chloroflexota bacterium]|nr:hypothetical protein [Chloroflexota bacterium]
MILPSEDAKLFFKLMWSLQYYVNQKLGFYKEISSREEYANLPTEKKLKARNALWEHPELIEDYARENPDAFPDDELEIVRRWTGFIKGSFFVLRHLKKGSIFIKDERVYAVHGILDPLDEVIPSYALPQMVEAVLLPFKGQIIYDGLLQGYSIHFGSGIRSNLNYDYTVAKHKERIITTLEPDAASQASPKSKPKKEIAPQLEELAEAMAKVKGNDSLQNSALALARAGMELALAVATNSDLAPAARKARKAFTRLYNMLKIMEDE